MEGKRRDETRRDIPVSWLSAVRVGTGPRVEEGSVAFMDPELVGTAECTVEVPDPEAACFVGLTPLVEGPFSETVALDTTSAQRNANKTRLSRRERRAGDDVPGDTLAEGDIFIRRIAACQSGNCRQKELNQNYLLR